VGQCSSLGIRQGGKDQTLALGTDALFLNKFLGIRRGGREGDKKNGELETGEKG